MYCTTYPAQHASPWAVKYTHDIYSCLYSACPEIFDDEEALTTVNKSKANKNVLQLVFNSLSQQWYVITFYIQCITWDVAKSSGTSTDYVIYDTYVFWAL